MVWGFFFPYSTNTLLKSSQHGFYDTSMCLRSFKSTVCKQNLVYKNMKNKKFIYTYIYTYIHTNADVITKAAHIWTLQTTVDLCITSVIGTAMKRFLSGGDSPIALLEKHGNPNQNWS